MSSADKQLLPYPEMNKWQGTLHSLPEACHFCRIREFRQVVY